MTNVLVLGSSGMLGRYVHSYLSTLPELTVTGYSRNEFDVLSDSIGQLPIESYDVIVNCIGIIKQVTDASPADSIMVNAVFPQRLAEVCHKVGKKFIHVTTDCVYSGNVGYYTEDSPHDPLDVYGKTKSLGESPLAMNIRTSIIGEELNTKRSLIEWVKSNDGKLVSGYLNHTWNGVTCLELAKFIGRCIQQNNYWEGTRHIFNTTPTTKMELVRLIAKHFGIKLSIGATETPTAVYRTLSTNYSTEITTSIDEQLQELSEYKLC